MHGRCPPLIIIMMALLFDPGVPGNENWETEMELCLILTIIILLLLLNIIKHHLFLRR